MENLMKNNALYIGKDLLSSKKLVYVFTGFILFTWLLHICLLVLGHSSQLSMYFNQFGDLFADFLNPVRFSANRDPFFDETIHPMHHQQPGIMYIFCWTIAKIASLKGPIKGAELSDLWNNHLLIVLTFYYLMFNMFLIVHSLLCLTKKFKTNRIILLPLLLSYPMLFSIERANHIMFVAACIFYFISFYDSNNEKEAFFACLFLALAASLKIFPALFGFLYFEKKQFKQIIISASMAFLLFFFPFFFFKHGIHNFPRLLSNMSQFASVDYKVNILKIISLAALVLSLFQKRLFDRLLCIVFPLLFLSRGSFYTTLYFFPLVILLFNQVDCEYLHISLFNKIVFTGFFAFLLMPLMIADHLVICEHNENRVLYSMYNSYIFYLSFIVILVRQLLIIQTRNIESI